MGRFDPNQYVELTMHFKCNLKCEHCMILDSMHRLTPEPMDRFQQVLDYNRQHHRFTGLTLTGAEITLRKDLPELARMARKSGFDHVRIQTHGMHLANPAYCRELVAAGIDEYFVSVTAADARTHDSITKVPGSFDRTLRGLENLDACEGVTTLTNTVITQRSFRQLPDVVARLSHLRRLAQMEFWNYYAMSETDDKDLVASCLESVPFLRQAIARARELGRSVDVKNFPECLLGDDADALDNNQPKLFIDPTFWPDFIRNGFEQCIHRTRCSSQKCLGLNTAYIRKFGWHEDALTPLPPSAGQTLLSATPEPPVRPARQTLLPVIQDPPARPVGQTFLSVPVPAPATADARHLLDIVTDLHIRYGIEHSFRICHGSLLTNRFLCSISKASLGPNPAEPFFRLCERLGLPDEFLSAAGENLPRARFIHLGFEENRDSRLYKIYLEFPLPAGHTDIQLLHLAFKWDTHSPARRVITKYHCHPGLSLNDILARVSVLFGPRGADALRITQEIVQLATARMPADRIRYMEATEAGNSRTSFDLNLYDAALRVQDIQPLLERMCDRHAVPPEQFQPLYARIQAQSFGHLAGGIHRDGRDFFNIYHGVESRHG